jgi:CheY-like chemotaxis protein
MVNKKILVVDDSKPALFMESMILRNGRYFVINARDGVEAVEKAVAELPDLILMDVDMPRKTGLDACRELKRGDATRHIPIILVTSRGEGEAVERGFESGCDDYLTKPFDALELLSKVRGRVGG